SSLKLGVLFRANFPISRTHADITLSRSGSVEPPIKTVQNPRSLKLSLFLRSKYNRNSSGSCSFKRLRACCAPGLFEGPSKFATNTAKDDFPEPYGPVNVH